MYTFSLLPSPPSPPSRLLDLANLHTLCRYLKKVELKFDLTSMCTELQKQIAQEFDFRKEAASLRSVGPALEVRLFY
jgi:predicted unusual protein kinase regulating ubiquinone biosynthesis (AarF/ABC1/UbiB family)